MKRKQPELEVDFIGGGRPLTKEDEIAISNYIRDHKTKRADKLTSRGKRISSSRKQKRLTK